MHTPSPLAAMLQKGQSCHPFPFMPIPDPNGFWMGCRLEILFRQNRDPRRPGMGSSPPPVLCFNRSSRSETVVVFCNGRRCTGPVCLENGHRRSLSSSKLHIGSGLLLAFGRGSCPAGRAARERMCEGENTKGLHTAIGCRK